MRELSLGKGRCEPSVSIFKNYSILKSEAKLNTIRLEREICAVKRSFRMFEPSFLKDRTAVSGIRWSLGD